ncbi:hypothetical protein [Sporomusa sp. KB1]|uniref:hypothetical protein n=1 Tax=Sporomusa sp. KB1 TaxID=943346 RepID=UPI0011A5AE05|nr:hypothetical protein [Sporomusa sp. KB1]TWH45913.1 hypothetical protein Salpa_1845 [Sporomusa sp. KB1]
MITRQRATVKQAIKDGLADANASIAGMFTIVYTGQFYKAVPGDRIPDNMEIVLQFTKDARQPLGWTPIVKRG